jgi:hypothetical protein
MTTLLPFSLGGHSWRGQDDATCARRGECAAVGTHLTYAQQSCMKSMQDMVRAASIGTHLTYVPCAAVM